MQTMSETGVTAREMTTEEAIARSQHEATNEYADQQRKTIAECDATIHQLEGARESLADALGAVEQRRAAAIRALEVFEPQPDVPAGLQSPMQAKVPSRA